MLEFWDRFRKVPGVIPVAFRKARAQLYAKYPQYPEHAALDESDSVIVEVTPSAVFSWGLD